MSDYSPPVNPIQISNSLRLTMDRPEHVWASVLSTRTTPMAKVSLFDSKVPWSALTGRTVFAGTKSNYMDHLSNLGLAPETLASDKFIQDAIARNQRALKSFQDFSDIEGRYHSRNLAEAQAVVDRLGDHHNVTASKRLAAFKSIDQLQKFASLSQDERVSLISGQQQAAFQENLGQLNNKIKRSTFEKALGIGASVAFGAITGGAGLGLAATGAISGGVGGLVSGGPAAGIKGAVAGAAAGYGLDKFGKALGKISQPKTVAPKPKSLLDVANEGFSYGDINLTQGHVTRGTLSAQSGLARAGGAIGSAAASAASQTVKDNIFKQAGRKVSDTIATRGGAAGALTGGLLGAFIGAKQYATTPSVELAALPSPTPQSAEARTTQTTTSGEANGRSKKRRGVLGARQSLLINRNLRADTTKGYIGLRF